MIIQVYERFDDTVGELWETITFDLYHGAPRWDLRCDFRMPNTGALRFMHPINDESLEFAYSTPTVRMQYFVPGVINERSFTPELRSAWEALPATWSCRIGPMRLECRKDIVDALECNALGELYLYRPHSLILA